MIKIMPKMLIELDGYIFASITENKTPYPS